LRELGRLLNDVGAALFRVGEKNPMGPLIGQIRTEFLPVLVNLMDTLASGGLGSALVDLATNLGRLLTTLAGAGGGGFSAFVGTLNGLASGLNTILSIPGLGTLASTLLEIGGAVAALSFAGKVTGITSLAGSFASAEGSAHRLFAAMAGAEAVGFAGSIGAGVRALGELAAAAAVAGGALILEGLASAGVVITAGISAVASGIATVATSAWAAAVWVLDAALAVLTSPITLVIAAIAAVVAGLIFAYFHFQAFRTVVDAVSDAIRVAFFAAVNYVVEAFNAIVGAVSSGVSAIPGIISGIGSWIAGAWSAIWNTMTTVVSAVWDTIITILQVALALVLLPFVLFATYLRAQWDAAWNNLSGTVSAVWGVITAVIGAGLAVLSAMWSATWTWVSDLFSAIWNGMLAALSAIWGVISGALSIGLGWAQAVWSATWTAISDFFTAIWNAIFAAFTGAWALLSAAFSVGLGWLQAVWSAVWSAVAGFFVDTWNAIQGMFGAAWAALSGALSGGLSWLQGIWSDVWNNVLNVGRGIWGAISGAINDFVNVIVGSFTWVRDRISDVWGGIREAFAAPIRFVVNTVWNDGLRKAWNTAAKLVGLGELGAVQLGFQRGGPVPGIGTGDKIRALLEPNEFVVRRDGSNLGEAIAHYAGRAGYALGGVVDAATGRVRYGLGGVVGWIGDGISDAIGDVVQFFRNGIGAGMELLLKPVRGLLNNALPAGDDWKGLVNAAGNTIMDKIVEFVKGKQPAGGTATSGDWGVHPGVAAIGHLVQQLFGITDIGGYRVDSFHEHDTGQVLDFMTYANTALGNALNAFLLALPQTRYDIWQQAMWYPGQAPRGMADRGSPTQNHRDHVHWYSNAAGGTYQPVRGGAFVRVAEAGRAETIVDTGTLNQGLSELAAMVSKLDVAGGRKVEISTVVNNPSPEPPSESVNKRMRRLAAFGAFE
jgi:phage-related protein